VSSSKIREILQSLEMSILLYESDSWSLTKTLCKKLDGNYTRLLRATLDVDWKSHTSNTQLYNGLPRITRVIRDRRLALAGHVMRHDEMAGRVLLWRPDEKRRRGRPSLTLKRVIEEDVGLQDGDLLSVMRDRVVWKNFIASPDKDELN